MSTHASDVAAWLVGRPGLVCRLHTDSGQLRDVCWPWVEPSCVCWEFIPSELQKRSWVALLLDV